MKPHSMPNKSTFSSLSLSPCTPRRGPLRGPLRGRVDGGSVRPTLRRNSIILWAGSSKISLSVGVKPQSRPRVRTYAGQSVSRCSTLSGSAQAGQRSSPASSSLSSVSRVNGEKPVRS